jgi:glycosyltransferase involved in cell wall biosynthesis
VTAPLASVVIRSKDEADSIGRLLDILSAQSIADRLELIVVDSGSTDATVRIARERGVEPIAIPAQSFTFGGALNRGCEAASAPVIVALSAHAFPPDERWAERMVAAFDDERVACACGDDLDPGGQPLRTAVLQDAEHARRHPFWGYSNAAGGFRAELWRTRPWREDMPGTEDKQWAWARLNEGWLVRVDPDLWVEHDHSHDDLRSTYVRSRREWIGYAMYLDLPPFPARAALRRWWSDRDGHATAARARLSPWRAARLAGEWAGRRRA